MYIRSFRKYLILLLTAYFSVVSLLASDYSVIEYSPSEAVNQYANRVKERAPSREEMNEEEELFAQVWKMLQGHKEVLASFSRPESIYNLCITAFCITFISLISDNEKGELLYGFCCECEPDRHGAAWVPEEGDYQSYERYTVSEGLSFAEAVGRTILGSGHLVRHEDRVGFLHDMQQWLAKKGAPSQLFSDQYSQYPEVEKIIKRVCRGLRSGAGVIDGSAVSGSDGGGGGGGGGGSSTIASVYDSRHSGSGAAGGSF